MFDLNCLPDVFKARNKKKGIKSTVYCRSVGVEGAGEGGLWAMAPPNFGRSVNPISTRRVNYAH